jgi:energy-coupling factor transporter ATP-binding protein EcfA2
MITLSDVSVTYAGAARPALHGADLHIDEGEFVLVVGPTGSGKSTLLRCLNGLVPHFSGGSLTGTVCVGGRDTRDHRPRDLADLVGFVLQDPMSSFVTDTVEDEIAYGMETLGVEPLAMRRRLEETLDLLGLADLRDRSLGELSGGHSSASRSVRCSRPAHASSSSTSRPRHWTPLRQKRSCRRCTGWSMTWV